MADESEKRMRPKRVAGDYEVGYGKPPVGGQFGPGRPGNRNGRPRHARTVEEAITRILPRKLTGKRARRARPRTWAELIAEQIVMGAINGDQNMIGELQAYLPFPLSDEELRDQEERPAMMARLVAHIYELAEARKELALHRMIARDFGPRPRPKGSWEIKDLAAVRTNFSPLAHRSLSPLELSLGPWLRDGATSHLTIEGEDEAT